MIFNIGLIDYGMGNLHSVKQAFKRLNQNIIIVKKPSEIDACSALVLPGVGSFDPAMINLNNTGLIPYIKEWAEEKKPLLGICLGLQLLFESSEEGNEKGLGIFKGPVKHLPKNQNERIPHMGWSKLTNIKSCPLLKETDPNYWVYFVHSYSAISSKESDLSASVIFGDLKVTAIVWKDSIGACQFHPEKSGKSGQRMLFNWIEWIKQKPLTLN